MAEISRRSADAIESYRNTTWDYQDSGLPIDQPPTHKHTGSPCFGPALNAKAGQLLELIQAAYDTYCGKVHSFLTFIPAVQRQTTPAGRCRVFFQESNACFGIPGTTILTESNRACLVKLLNGMTQLQHTMEQTVTAMIGSLRASQQSCQSSSSNNPCDITCDQHRQPEHEVVCAFNAILPHIEQYINLLVAETGKMSTTAPIDILVDSTIDQPNLRYHQVDVTQYARDEIQINKDFQDDYP